jgi:hypothetical protein
MNEEKIKLINEKAGLQLQEWLTLLETGQVTHEDVLSSLYASMITAYLYGYSPDTMAIDAKAAAERLINLVKIENGDENGVSNT